MKWLRKHKLQLAVLLVAVFSLVSFAVHLVHANGVKDQHKMAAIAEQQRIADDPLTVEQLYKDVNIERAKAGVAPLNLNQALNTSAQQKCDDMATNKYYDHFNPTTNKEGYSYIFDDLSGTGYVNENLGQAYDTVAGEFITNWLNSPAHKKEMLSAVYTETGFGICKTTFPTVVEHFASLRPEEVQRTVYSQPVQQTVPSRPSVQYQVNSDNIQFQYNKATLCEQFKALSGNYPPNCL